MTAWPIVRSSTTDRVVLRICLVGALLVLATTVVAARTRSQRSFVVLTSATFLIASGALSYVVETGDDYAFLFYDSSSIALFVGLALLFGVLGSAALGMRFFQVARAGFPPPTVDTHHPALQRAGVLSIVSAVVTAAELTPTLFFWLPPMMLVFGTIACALVARRDLTFERHLLRISEGVDEVYAIVEAEKDAPQLARVARWAAEILDIEHGYVIKKQAAAGSYRQGSEREVPLMSVPMGRTRAPRVVLIATSALSALGGLVVVVLVATAPIISVPSNIRTLYGVGTRYELHRQVSWEVEPPRGVVLYDVTHHSLSRRPPPQIGYDRAHGAILSGRELFVRLPQNGKLEYLADAAVNFLIDEEGRFQESSEKPEIIGRELYFSYTTSSGAMGRYYRPSTRAITRCSVNLDTGVLGGSCKAHDVAVPPNEGSMGQPTRTFDKDPHHLRY